jgi:DNA repair ATPase RecN
MRSENSEKKESGIPAAPKAKNSAESLKKIKQVMNQKLSDSNRLAQDVESMKKKAGKIAEAAKNRIRQILKNSDKLSGDQIVALKDVVLQLKQYRDNVDAQEQAISRILVRLQDLRSMEKYAESVPVLDELITAQKKMIEILKGSGMAMTHIGTILKS